MNSHFYLKPLLAGMLFVAACCNDKPFENPLDPASEDYIPPLTTDKGIMIDDFDDGKDPNLLGFCPRIFRDSLKLADIFVDYNNQRENVLRGVGHSLQIGFILPQQGIAFGGHVQALARIGNDTCSLSRGFFNLANLNLDTLTFWVRTTFQRVNFEVAVKDSAGNQTDPKVLIRNYLIPNARWRKARIPISALRPAQKGGTVDFQSIKEINFGFVNYLDGTALSGTIYLDEIAFER